MISECEFNFSRFKKRLNVTVWAKFAVWHWHSCCAVAMSVLRCGCFRRWRWVMKLVRRRRLVRSLTWCQSTLRDCRMLPDTCGWPGRLHYRSVLPSTCCGPCWERVYWLDSPLWSCLCLSTQSLQQYLRNCRSAQIEYLPLVCQSLSFRTSPSSLFVFL